MSNVITVDNIVAVVMIANRECTNKSRYAGGGGSLREEMTISYPNGFIELTDFGSETVKCHMQLGEHFPF